MRVLILGLLFIGACNQCKPGEVAKQVNCRMQTMYIAQKMGSGTTIMLPHTYQECDTVCERGQ